MKPRATFFASSAAPFSSAAAVAQAAGSAFALRTVQIVPEHQSVSLFASA